MRRLPNRRGFPLLMRHVGGVPELARSNGVGLPISVRMPAILVLARLLLEIILDPVDFPFPVPASLIFEQDVGGAVVPIPVHRSGSGAYEGLVPDLSDIGAVHLPEGHDFGFLPRQSFDDLIITQTKRERALVIARRAVKDAKIVPGFGRNRQFARQTPQPVELFIRQVFARQAGTLVSPGKGVVLLIDMVDDPAIEISQYGQTIFPGAQAIDHLARLRPAHDVISGHDLPVHVVVLVDFRQNDVQRRELGMNIGIERQFHS